MRKRCQEKGCKKIATTYHNGNLVCKSHACRCKNNLEASSWFGGCLLHSDKKNING